MEIGINELQEILSKHYGKQIYINGYYTGDLIEKKLNKLSIGDVFSIEVQ